MSNQARHLFQIPDAGSLPQVLLQLLDACNNENIAFSRLAEIIRTDAALLLRLIATGREPFDGSEALDRVISRRKLNNINSIAISTSVQQYFGRHSKARTRFLKQHWQHTLLCACVAETIARRIEYREPEQAWVAGLLHDVGQLLLAHAHGDDYTIVRDDYDGDEDLTSIETEHFKTRHDILGAELLGKHHGSALLADAVRYHHEPAERIRDAHPLVRVVNLANSLSHEAAGKLSDATLTAAQTLFDLQQGALDDMLKQSRIRMTEIAASFEIDAPAGPGAHTTDLEVAAKDELVELQLAEQVRNIAMLDAVHQHLARIDGEASLLAAIRQNISILFGIERSILFLYQPGTDRIRACADGGSEADFNDISIPLESGRSLVTEALLQQQSANSFASSREELSIIDHQLIGLTAHEGILCLPMIVNNAAIGTLVLGIDKAALPLLLKQQGLLKRFTNEVAATLSSARNENTVLAMHTDDGKQIRARIREVAHEVRNPLSIINNYLDILGFKLGGDNPAQKDLETIKGEISRIGGILDKLNEPARSGDHETSLVDINALIADLSHVFQTSLFAANNISISLDLDDTLPPVLSNPNALKQIYTNLVKNAVEALPANGQLMVYTQDQVNVDGNAHFEICVADDGPGIDPAILPNLFSPVQTTKGEGHAGLGLTIVKNLVNELQGSISCRSSDKGTGFYILLPRNTQQ